MYFVFFLIILIIFGEGGYLPILRICQILNSRFKVGLSILMHPSTAVDPYLALNCAQHLAALLHGGIFFRKVSWISTKCVASSVKVCSGKLWPKKCQIWHRLSGDQVSKRVAEVSKRLHINVLYKTQSNTKYNTIWHFALNCLQLAQMPNRRQLTPSKVFHSPNTASLRPMLFTESQCRSSEQV